MGKVVLAIGAHPDDMEYFAAGTLILLSKKGYETWITSLTAGECGSNNLQPTEIVSIRSKEAKEAARVIGANYKCLGIQDGCVNYELDTTRLVVALIREIRPEVVITHPTVDYMADHAHTGQLVLWAVPESRHHNFPVKTPDPALERRPYVYHTDPEGLTLPDGQLAGVNTIIDISSVFNQKLAAISAHESQLGPTEESGEPALIKRARREAIIRGHQARVEYGEGFCQQLLEGYPRRNILSTVLGEKVITL